MTIDADALRAKVEEMRTSAKDRHRNSITYCESDYQHGVIDTCGRVLHLIDVLDDHGRTPNDTGSLDGPGLESPSRPQDATGDG